MTDWSRKRQILPVKKSRYGYRSTYTNHNQKPTINTKKTRKKHKKTTKENQTIREEKNRSEQRTTKPTGKQVIKWQ